MAGVKKTDVAKKGLAPTVSAPFIPLKSDSIIQEKKKEEAPIVKKDEPKKDEVKTPQGPTLEDLAKQQIPTVEEAQKREKVEKAKVEQKSSTASPEDIKKTDAAANVRLEEIAAQERVVRQQARSAEYKVPAAAGPQSAYQSNSQSTDPTSVYRPSHAEAPYTTNQKQQELPQRGGITHYDMADLQRHVGREEADKLLEEKRQQIHGDKGLFSKYNKR